MLHPACILDSALTAAEAVRRLQVHEGLRFALLRHQRGLRITWHAFERAALLQALVEASLHRSVDEVGAELGLFAEAEEVLDARSATASQLETRRAVLLEGDRVLGWLLPDGGPSQLRGVYERPERPTRSGWRIPHGGIEYFDPRHGGDPGAGSPRWFADGDPIPFPALTADAFYGYPRLAAPAIVAPGERFEVTVGIADGPVLGVAGTAVVIRDLAPGTREIELEIQVVADGFAAPEGWRHLLRIVLAEPEAAVVRLPLVAPGAERLGSIDVHFSHRGAPCGSARRHVAVRAPQAAKRDRGPGRPWTRGGAPPRELRVPFAEAAPDLTVWITKSGANPAGGRLLWTFSSPHPVALPTEPLMTDLGGDPATFARNVVRVLGEEEETGGFVAELMEGLGDAIRRQVPPALWEVLRQLWALAAADGGRPPAVLLLSEEGYVPWELALVEPALDPARPPFLGSQVAIGRWILDASGPPIPPPHVIQVPDFAVVTAVYTPESGYTPLDAAVREAQELTREHGAIPVALRVGEIRGLLRGALEKGDRPARIGALHFACHGRAGSGNPRRDALVMEDGTALNPLVFLRAKLAQTHPFLFLNACQTGQSGELLGMVGGFAGNCLSGGFRGFVAPFWAVADDLAEELAVAFYRGAFGAEGRRGAPVAEILRDLRRRYDPDAETVSLTPLAYVFYGHPRLVLERDPGTAAREALRPGITPRRSGPPAAPPPGPAAPARDG